jgi:hypothetical protein
MLEERHNYIQWLFPIREQGIIIKIDQLKKEWLMFNH